MVRVSFQITELYFYFNPTENVVFANVNVTLGFSVLFDGRGCMLFVHGVC